MLVIPLVRLGDELKDPVVAESEHLPAIQREVQSAPPGSDVVLDCSGVRFIGYSYAKQAILPLYEELIGRRFPHRSLTLAYDGDDYEVQLETVNLALAELRITSLLRLTHVNRLAPLGYLAYESPFETRQERRKKEKLLRVLKLVMLQTAMYTNEIARSLRLTLPNCNYLLAELETSGLVERIKESSPSGGPLYLNRVIVESAWAEEEVAG